MNDDDRLRIGLRVNALMDTIVHKMIVEITNDNAVSQYFIVNIMVCGSMHPIAPIQPLYSSLFPLHTVLSVPAFEKTFYKNDINDAFTAEGKYVLKLSDLYEVAEVTSWRDPAAFLETLSDRCLELSYSLCTDEFCETEYNDISKVTLEDFLGDGTT